jgi:hypothetical protein
VDICYEMDSDSTDRHPLLGKWAPNLCLHVERGTSHLAELMCAGKGVLVNLTERSAWHDLVTKWADRVTVISAPCYERPANLGALLVRPDGYVAWVLRSDDTDAQPQRTLRAALEKWFGAAG